MNAVRAEVRKLLTLPALRITALLTWIATLLLAWAVRRGAQPGGDDGGLAALGYTQAGFLIIGVLAAAHEHQSGGQIRTTLLAMPRRLRLAAAKAVALIVVALPVAAAVAATNTLVGRGTAPAAASAYLTGTALLAAAAATVLRRTVPAAALLLAAYMIAGPVLRARFPGTAQWLPDTAVLDPRHGAVAALAWMVAALAGAAVALHRRDA